VPLSLAKKLFISLGGTMIVLLVVVFTILQQAQAQQWEAHLREQSLSFARFATPELLKLFRGDFAAREAGELSAVEDFLGFNPDLVEFSFYSPSGRRLFASPRFPAYLDLEDIKDDPQEIRRRVQALHPTQMTLQLVQGGRLLDVLVPAYGPTGQHLVSVRYLLSYAGVDRRLAAMRHSFLQLLAVVAVVSLLAVALVTRGITRPVRRLTDGALQIARGDLETRIPVSGGAEIGELARTFNDMAGSLATNRAELLNAQQQVLQNERLAAIGQMAAGISHEIDNPVGVILGYAELLLEDLDAADPQRDDVQAIIDECRRCKRITGGLLNLARHREGDRYEVDLLQLVDAVLGSLRPQALFRHVALKVEAHAEVSVVGDVEQLRQILVNLLLNAAQALRGEGKIFLRIYRDAAMGGVEIVDSGPGIPAKLREKIFEPFFTTKPGGEGNGLGLAICRRLADDHGGRLTPLDLDEGAGFRLEIPLPAAEKCFDNNGSNSLG